MRIALFALGSRGDIQPYIALGKGLAAAGHDVRLLSHENYENLISTHGLDFRPMKGDVQAVLESPEMRQLVEQGNFIAINRAAAQKAKEAAVHWAEDGLAACRGVDLIITGIGGFSIAVAVAEKLDLPVAQAYLVPFSPTRDFPSVLLPAAAPRLGGLFNRVTHHLTRQMMWTSFRGGDKLSRRQVLDLPAPPITGPYRSPRLNKYPVLFGFSPSVVPRPGDWDERQVITGYWFLDAEQGWQPPEPLAEFLAQGPTPVYIGFGSMSNRKPQETTDLVLRALAHAGQRAIILSGWGGLGAADLPDTVLAVDSVPHSWLFPRMAAVVHHGGAGTTAAGLRAGVPTVVTPFFGDQYFWGQRVEALGAGPAPIPRKELTAEALGEAIRQAVAEPEMRRRAAALGASIRDEDGVTRAVGVLQTAMPLSKSK